MDKSPYGHLIFPPVKKSYTNSHKLTLTWALLNCLFVSIRRIRGAHLCETCCSVAFARELSLRIDFVSVRRVKSLSCPCVGVNMSSTDQGDQGVGGVDGGIVNEACVGIEGDESRSTSV